MKSEDQGDPPKPVRGVLTALPARDLVGLLDVLEVGPRRFRESRRSSATPPRDLHFLLLYPAFDFVDRFDAIGALARLEVETLRADARVERREIEISSGGRLDDRERRGQPARRARPEEVASRERIAEEHFVVSRVEKALARPRDPPARHAPNHRRHRLDRPLHRDRHIPLQKLSASLQSSFESRGDGLLPAGPDQPLAFDSKAVCLRRELHRSGVEAVRVLVGEHQKADPEPVDFDGRLGKVEAELHEGAASRRNEHLARRSQRDDRRHFANDTRRFGGTGETCL